MPIKNFWSLEAGEAMVADELQHKLPRWEVFFPIKDVGVDLLAASGVGTNVVQVLTFQVKESRAHPRRKNDLTPPNTNVNWFSIDSAKMQRFQSRVNFYVFVCSHYDFVAARKNLVPSYMIIPSRELIRRLRSYSISTSKKRWFLYLCVEESRRCLDWRGITRKNKDKEIERAERNYSSFLNNWEQVNSHTCPDRA
jgi:hypothetical protein